MDKCIEKIIRQTLKPENYGFGELMARPISYNENGQPIINVESRVDPNNFDCLSGAIISRDILHQNRISAFVLKGEDQWGFWKGLS